jgi:hypothetical protein
MSPLVSPRQQRRLAWGLGALAACSAVVLLVLLLPRGRPELVTTLRAGGTTTHAAKPFTLTPAMRLEIDSVVQAFVRTAVVRRNLDTAWELASAKLRGSITRERWRAGELPVFPFPEQAFAKADWRLRFTFGRTAAIDVMVLPKPGSGLRTLVYGVELTDYGAPGHRHWLVDTWFPQTTLTTGEPPATTQTTVGTGVTTGPNPYRKGKLDARWLLVPLGVLTLIALVPLFLLVRGIVRRRWATRRYRDPR